MPVNGLSILTDNLYVATDSGVYVVNKHTGNYSSQKILSAADDIDTARIYNPALYSNTRKGIKIKHHFVISINSTHSSELFQIIGSLY